MKYILITILLLNSAKAQDYIFYWVGVPKEPNVVNYQVQRSTNNVLWTTIPNATFSPKKRNDSNKYQYTITPANVYIRLKTLMTTTTLYTLSKRIINTNVTITNPILSITIKSDNLKFTASNEAAADYYSITRKNSSSSNWVVAGKLMQTNKRNYEVNITKVGFNRQYRLQVFYKSGIVSPYISFQ